MPREIEYEKIVEAVKEIALRANYKLPKDVVHAFSKPWKGKSLKWEGRFSGRFC
jgi:tartrate dehydratase alpha subunit/fumarate hydratase class I-like protein